MKFRPIRLGRVAKALEESPKPKEFTMAWYGVGCKTPQCALGHYAYRKDLQKLLRLDRDGALRVGDDYADYNDPEVCEHFGISPAEADELFSDTGCGNPATPLEAAAYIRDFIRRKRCTKSR